MNLEDYNMRDLIRKVLQEKKQKGKEEDSIEDVIEEIKSNKKRIEKLLPAIVDFFESTYKNDLHKIEVNKDGSVHYGMENFSIDNIELVFFFNQIPKGSENIIRRNIIMYLRDVFNVDITRYGVPLDVSVYVKTWKKVDR
jgi:hypothetical protein